MSGTSRASGCPRRSARYPPSDWHSHPRSPHAVREGLRYRLAGALGGALGTALLATVRFRTLHRERYDALTQREQPVLCALWHGRLLPLTYFHRHYGIAAMISQSKDGEHIARIVEKWGIEAVRGSTSRGGAAALREVARRIRAGQSVAITPDGPKGPRQRVQPGIIAAAQLTGAPILPVVAGCTRAWWPGKWDRFCIPKPFSKVLVLYGEPRLVPRDTRPSEFARHALELENELNAMLEQVDRQVQVPGREFRENAS
jgi:lysophospholipid acyltransferase (LPLAT)-like uncharacterized protein